MRAWKLCLLVLAIASSVDAGERRSRRYAVQSCASGQCATVESSPRIVDVSPVPGVVDVSPSKPAATAKGDDDALHEVNAARAKRGLPALLPDLLLNQAARACAKERAARGIHGHLESDFVHLPSSVSTNGVAAGCAALEPSWGWQSCCWDDPKYTVGGAAWVMGRDGLRYMHIFCR